MSQGFGYPAFPIDTHIHRLAQRWGLTNGKNVIQTEEEIKRLFPKKSGINYIQQFITVENTARQGMLCISCKICTSCYPKRKNQLKQRKRRMKILGIGNAIVDVICKVDENFINRNKLTKGTMKLIFDDKEFQSMLSNQKIKRTISGGSVANSIVGLSQLGNKVGFIGKVSDDDLGNKYEDGLKSGAEYLH